MNTRTLARLTGDGRTVLVTLGRGTQRPGPAAAPALPTGFRRRLMVVGANRAGTVYALKIVDEQMPTSPAPVPVVATRPLCPAGNSG